MPRLERQTFTWRLTLLAVWDRRREATAEDLVGMLRAVLPSAYYTYYGPSSRNYQLLLLPLL